MSGYFEVALELDLLLGNLNVALVRLFYKDELVSVTPDDVNCLFVATILELKHF